MNPLLERAESFLAFVLEVEGVSITGEQYRVLTSRLRGHVRTASVLE